MGSARYRMAGLRRVVRAIDPDVFHAHFLVEHGFYGLSARVRPYVVTAWGSDALVEPQRDPVSRWIARRVVRRADLVTSNNGYMAERIVELGASVSAFEVVTLRCGTIRPGASRRSVNPSRSGRRTATRRDEHARA